MKLLRQSLHLQNVYNLSGLLHKRKEALKQPEPQIIIL